MWRIAVIGTVLAATFVDPTCLGVASGQSVSGDEEYSRPLGSKAEVELEWVTDEVPGGAHVGETHFLRLTNVGSESLMLPHTWQRYVEVVIEVEGRHDVRFMPVGDGPELPAVIARTLPVGRSCFMSIDLLMAQKFGSLDGTLRVTATIELDPETLVQGSRLGRIVRHGGEQLSSIRAGYALAASSPSIDVCSTGAPWGEREWERVELRLEPEWTLAIRRYVSRLRRLPEFDCARRHARIASGIDGAFDGIKRRLLVDWERTGADDVFVDLVIHRSLHLDPDFAREQFEWCIDAFQGSTGAARAREAVRWLGTGMHYDELPFESM